MAVMSLQPLSYFISVSKETKGFIFICLAKEKKQSCINMHIIFTNEMTFIQCNNKHVRANKLYPPWHCPWFCAIWKPLELFPCNCCKFNVSNTTFCSD